MVRTPKFPKSWAFSVSQNYDDGGNWYVEGYPSSLEPNLDRFGPSEELLILEESAQQDLVDWSKRLPTVFLNHNLLEEIGAVKESELRGGRYWAKILITKTRPDVWQKIKEGVLSKFSVQFIPTDTVTAWNEQYGKNELRVRHLVGLETSIVGLPANDHVEMIRWYVGQNAAYPKACDANPVLLKARIAAPAFSADGRLAFSAQVVLPDVDPSAIAKAAEGIIGRVVVQGASAIPGAVVGSRIGHITASYAHGKTLYIHGLLDAHSPTAASLRIENEVPQAVGLSILKAKDGSSLAVGLIEVSDDEVPMTKQQITEEIRKRQALLATADDHTKEGLAIEIASLEALLAKSEDPVNPAAVEQSATAVRVPAEPVSPAEAPSSSPPASVAAADVVAPPASAAPEADPTSGDDSETIRQAVVPYRKYSTVTGRWVWNASVQNKILNAGGWDLYKAAHAWYDPDKSETKAGYKLPHHVYSGDGLKTHWPGTAYAMAALLGARGGVSIPESDRRAVYNHLAKHYKEFGKEPPEFKKQSWDEFTMFHVEQGLELEDDPDTFARFQDVLGSLATLLDEYQAHRTEAKAQSSVSQAVDMASLEAAYRQKVEALEAFYTEKIAALDAKVRELELRMDEKAEAVAQAIASKMAELEAIPVSGPNGTESAPVRRGKDRMSVWEDGVIIRALHGR